MRPLLVAMCIIGTMVPMMFLVDFFLVSPLSAVSVIENLFQISLWGGFVADLLISILVFLVWTFYEIGRDAYPMWLILLATCCLVGQSLALPLCLSTVLYRRKVGTAG